MIHHAHEIELSKGKIALVSAEDYDRLNKVKWYALNYGNGTFAAARGGGGGLTIMHREILGDIPEGFEVDHINGDSLDNRRENLRICTHSQNRKNNKKYKTNTSGFMGVYWRSNRRKWVAMIYVDGKRRYLGHYDAPEEAAVAYDEAAIRLHGEFATLNFQSERL